MEIKGSGDCAKEWAKMPMKPMMMGMMGGKKAHMVGTKSNTERHWIQGAIKHPGALHEMMDVPEGKKIPSKRLNAAAKKGGLLGRRAHLAKTLKKLNK